MRAKKTYATLILMRNQQNHNLTQSVSGRTDTRYSDHFMLHRAFDISFAGDVDVSKSALACPL
jgi:hypothetical protein